ncbi:glycosyltransferase family 4 protein [candidate division TA06 bacterium]|nr:glycosyltransferase family 4 protein [candidate division TA06 bacterium]
MNESRIKLLMISGSFPPIKDGVGDYCSCLCREMAVQGKLDIDIVTSSQAVDPSIPGLTVHPVVNSWSWSGLSRTLMAFHQVKPDIVHIQYPSITYKRHLMPNLLPLFLRLAGAERIIITLHGFGLYTWLGKLRLSLPSAFSHGIITVSQHIKLSAGQFWRGPLGFLKARLEETVFTGSSIEACPVVTAGRKVELKNKWGVKPHHLAVSYFGFINDGKGFDDLLRALRICLDQDLPCHLVCLSDFIPDEDSYHLKIKQLFDSLGLGGQVTFTGYLCPQEVAEALASCDYSVLPFNYGASTKRSSLLAALACGCPVITTNDDSLPPFFENGRNIVLVPPRDPLRLAEAMMHLGKDKTLLQGIGAGVKTLAGYFSWDKIADKHYKIYQKHLKTGLK